MSLMEKLKSAGSIKDASILSQSTILNTKGCVKTDLPIFNIAFSGTLNGGIPSGLSMLCGESATFKTLAALYCMKAYLNAHKDAVALLWDCEYGITPEYLKAQGIDTDRVLHIPITSLEDFKFDIVKRLDSIKRGDKVFLMLDSLGALSSKKEIDDAMDEKAVADLTRAKQIRGALRMITPYLTTKDLPFFVINHVYQTMALYSSTVIGGGTMARYAANMVIVITKSQEKGSDGELEGYNFCLNINKSRFVREKAKFNFSVNFETGIDLHSGLLPIALESGHAKKVQTGWYSRVNTETGEIEERKWRESATHCDEFWKDILADKTFDNFIKKSYQLSYIE